MPAGEMAEDMMPRERRLALLSGLPAFASLPAPALEALAARLCPENVPAGTVVVTEEEEGDCLFVIASGRAEVTITGARGPLPVATLGEGELFGEQALLTSERRRTATVTALTPLRLLRLDQAAFAWVLAHFPAVRAALETGAEARLIANFLKRASPFTVIAPARLAWLAGRLRRLDVPAGSVVVRQGESGDRCYLLREGKAEVLDERTGAGERQLSVLESGALFGETALLTGALRNATVRALTPCTLLELRRDDLLVVTGEDAAIAGQLRELVRLRDRPRQAVGIVAHQREGADGAMIAVLKDPARAAYYQLSPQGWFLWQRLDGRHTLRDLTLDYLREFGAFDPEAVAGAVAGLVSAGFAIGVTLRADAQGSAATPSLWRRLLAQSRRAMEWYVPLHGADPALTRLYRRGGWLLFTRPVLAVLALVVVAGLVAFFTTAGQVGTTLAAVRSRAWLPFLLVPAALCALLLHEAGHALTTKAFGREVSTVGVGWYWFGPVAFVDTSDMWLAGRGARLAVDSAGVAANLVVAGGAALAAWAVPGPTAAAILWQFALAQYLTVLLNLNPLLELDGYFVLIDALDRPNLRPHALSWLGQEALPALRRAGVRGLRGHSLEIGYGLAALAYIGVEAVLVVALYRLVLRGWLAALLPATAATALAWAVAAVAVVLTVARVLADLRGGRRMMS